MSVSDRDRRHFEVIGKAMAGKKEAQRREVAVTTPAQRVALGFILGAVPRGPGVEAAREERAAGQIGLARRRDALHK